ncbi:MAG TPA: alpha/beta hydrolase [Hyphomicrobiales bacterium]|nr:alpha/beta hydrolase [Hyphomicrobiales bacterium]
MTERLPELFPGFEQRRFKTRGAEIFARIGGKGPPLVLLHGYPETHAMWHRMAPKLAEHFTLIIPDLRGYGSSSIPSSDPDHFSYSKRAMAQDVCDVMDALGHGSFFVCGHDRGGRVAYRLALDEPSRVLRLCVLDIIPTYEMWHRLTPELAMKVFHWTFLAQPAPWPEKMIGADPIGWLDEKIGAWNGTGGLSVFAPEALAHYRAFFSEPERLHATCEDYRAGATYDLKADEADKKAGKRILCPALALWGSAGIPGKTDGPLAIWREWCADVKGEAIACGHFLPEEAPGETLAALRGFLLEG